MADLRGIALGCVAAEQPAGQCRDELGQFRVHGGGRGDQFVTIRIAVPKNLTSAQKELLRQFAATTGEADTLKTGLFNKKKK